MKKLSLLIVVICLLIPSAIALAKGGFDYITVKGPGITGEINITDPVLTEDFFAFADFAEDAIDSPADPGQGYEIVRIYVVTENEKPTPTPFDLLYYYPYAGYVYYQGLVSGSSEYDGNWYIANPSAEEPFRAVLAERARLTWIPFVVLVIILGVFLYAYYRKPKQQ